MAFTFEKTQVHRSNAPSLLNPACSSRRYCPFATRYYAYALVLVTLQKLLAHQTLLLQRSDPKKQPFQPLSLALVYFNHTKHQVVILYIFNENMQALKCSMWMLCLLAHLAGW